MLNLPTNPTSFQSRVFTAVIEDILDPHSAKWDRTNAIHAIKFNPAPARLENEPDAEQSRSE